MTPLKRLFGKDLQLDKLPAEIKPLLEQMRQERAAFEALLLQAEGTIKRAEQLGPSVGPLQQQVAQIEQRLAGLGELAAQFALVKQGAQELEEGHRGTRAQLEQTRSLAEAARTELEDMRGMLAEALKAKEVLPGLLEMIKPLGDLRSRAAALEERIREVAGGLDQLRAEHDQITGASAGAVTRLAELENNLQGAAGRLETFQTRAEPLERTLEELPQLLKEVPDVKRELSTLNVLAEYVSQKVTALEGQRDVVERSTQRTERLAELVGQVDRQVQEQHENTKFLSRLQSNVDELKKLHEAALQQAEAIEKKHRTIETEDRRLSEEFAAQREALQKSASQFRFERDGLDALSQRVADLRATLGAAEERLPVVDEARSGLEAAAYDAARLTASVEGIARQVQDLESAAATAQGVKAQVQQLQHSVEELTRRLDAVASPDLLQELAERTQQFEEARSRVARLERKLADWDALEERVDQSLRLATERRATVDTIRADLQRLFEMADATVARVRELAGLQEEIAERRQSLDPVLARLQELDRHVASLEERKKQFQEAEERLSRLDALLIDLQSTLKTVLDHKEFLERVVETAGSLALQTMQAEAAIKTLREATEAGKRKPHK